MINPVQNQNLPQIKAYSERVLTVLEVTQSSSVKVMTTTVAILSAVAVAVLVSLTVFTPIGIAAIAIAGASLFLAAGGFVASCICSKLFQEYWQSLRDFSNEWNESAKCAGNLNFEIIPDHLCDHDCKRTIYGAAQSRHYVLRALSDRVLECGNEAMWVEFIKSLNSLSAEEAVQILLCPWSHDGKGFRPRPYSIGKIIAKYGSDEVCRQLVTLLTTFPKKTYTDDSSTRPYLLNLIHFIMIQGNDQLRMGIIGPLSASPKELMERVFVRLTSPRGFVSPWTDKHAIELAVKYGGDEVQRHVFALFATFSKELYDSYEAMRSRLTDIVSFIMRECNEQLGMDWLQLLKSRSDMIMNKVVRSGIYHCGGRVQREIVATIGIAAVIDALRLSPRALNFRWVADDEGNVSVSHAKFLDDNAVLEEEGLEDFIATTHDKYMRKECHSSRDGYKIFRSTTDQKLQGPLWR